MSKSQECPLVSSEDSTDRYQTSFEGIELENIQLNNGETKIGLSSEEAYLRLCEIIRHELVVFNYDNRKTWFESFIDMLKNGEERSLFSWTSLVYLLLEILLLFLGCLLHEDMQILSLVELTVIIVLSSFNIVLCIKEEQYRRTEVPRKVDKLLSQCQDFKKMSSWHVSSYPSLTTPNNDSLSLTWTFRDEQLVNVPNNLLVEGDVILLAPGQKSPAFVEQVSSSDCTKLKIGEIFNSDFDNTENSTSQQIFSSNPCTREKFTVQEPPLIENLRKTFVSCQKHSLSVLDNWRYFVTKQTIEYKLIPIMIVISFHVNLLRYIFAPNDVGHWSQMCFTLQAYVFIPFLPVIFPQMWIAINWYGTSRIQAIFNNQDGKFLEKDLFSFSNLRQFFWSNAKGDSSCLTRTSNMLHTLGSISVWCCVDKDGILALPNLYAEKVFFFRKKKDRRHKKMSKIHHSSDDGLSTNVSEHHEIPITATTNATSTIDTGDMEYSTGDGDELSYEPCKTETPEILSPPVSPKEFSSFPSHSEVLNLTCDPQSQFGILFDDFRWQRHLSSLKPLGLNVLLNSPCAAPVNSMKFFDHLGHLSLLFNDTPIHAVRRCLCLLGKQIGFVDSALTNFQRKQSIFAFRTNIQLNESILQSHSFLTVCKENPIPFLTSLVVEHVPSGSHQLLSQGSADLLLDVCTDYWDGTEVHPLTSLERKKIRDFFHRTSITSNCIALSYRPITQPVNGTSKDVFLEIPDDISWSQGDSENASTCSSKSSSSSENLGEIQEGDDSPNDVQFYQSIIGGQIFIGMVTLQHQAKQEIPPLVEDLNNAGIRFVHFSDENEIKSRVFAERLGLEAGWNCHISFSEKSTGLDEHSTVTGGSDYKVEETAEGTGDDIDDEDHEFVISHVLENDEMTLGDIDEDMGISGVNDDGEKRVTWLEDRSGDRKYSCSSSSSSSSSNNEPVGETQADWDFIKSSNRAKLPRGIHNIRPHLQKVDNVPLLVPLFTECTPNATREMVEIMQENGEIVCCVGSSLNIDNNGVFNQADISIAIQPALPEVCLKDHESTRCDLPSFSSVNTAALETDHLINNRNKTLIETDLTPIEVSSALNGIPCSLSFGRDYKIKFVSLLREARRCCFGIQNCFTFMLSCQLTLCFVMLVSSLLLVAPPLSGVHLIWLSCFSVPLLSVTLVNVTDDADLMTIMTAKNDKNFSGYICVFIRYFGVAFLPCVMLADVIIFPSTLKSFCEFSATKNNCQYFLGNRDSKEYWNGIDCTQGLTFAQDIIAFFLLLCFVQMSASYVHRLHPLWKKTPFSNKPWIIIAFIVLVAQILFTVISQSIWKVSDQFEHTIDQVPIYILCIVFIWPSLQMVFCEYLKRKYIKYFIRYQKRAKLKFGTKLGMNSPF